MDKGIYTSLSGGIAKAHEIELISNNLANATTPGFKSDVGTFYEYLTELRRADTVENLRNEIIRSALEASRPEGDKSFVEMDAVYTNFQQGSLIQTGRKLDIAIFGEGFLEVLTPFGIRYTRQGNLSVSNDGVLVTINGYQILGKGAGEPNTRIIRLGQEPVEISTDGIIYQNGREIASLSIIQFHENQWLEKSGNTYYRNTDPRNIKPTVTKTFQIKNGFLESSNVNPIKEMTKLIEATRAYESHLQAIKTYQEIDTRSVNDIARLR